jgi:hypothetical protein
MSGKSYDAPETVPGRDLWGDDDRSLGDRPYDGGTGAPGFVKQVERAANELRTSDRPAALGPGDTTTGDASWWDRNHNGE